MESEYESTTTALHRSKDRRYWRREHEKHNLPVSSSYRKPPFENQHHSSPYHTLLAYKHIYSDSDKDSLKRHTQQRSYSDYNQDLSPAYNQELYRATPKVAGNNRFIVNRKRGQYDRRYKIGFLSTVQGKRRQGRCFR